MPHPRAPIDACAAKKLLRRYALMIPATSLIGGWCAVLMIAWIAFPKGVVDHLPLTVRVAASAVAVFWLIWLYRTFKRLPALVDEILERGLALTPKRARKSDHWLSGPDQHG